MRRATAYALSAFAGVALIASWIICLAIFGYGQYLGVVELLDGNVGEAIALSVVATLAAGLAQTIIGLLAAPAMALSERLRPGLW